MTTESRAGQHADGILLRLARTEDLDEIRALTFRAYDEYSRVMEAPAWQALAQAVSTALDSPDAIRIVAERGGHLVGSVMLFAPNVDAYDGLAGRQARPELRLLAVEPSARGQGIAGRLVAACVDQARAMHARELGLHTSRSMRAAIALYRRLGFARAPEDDFQPDGAEVVEGYRIRLE
jgi:ribosomal protein S18 acetylase RimI-like enzyme